jgi:hypothetical protein
MSKNLVKLALDLALALTFAWLFNMLMFGGLLFHEIAGLAIGAGFILHKLLSWGWIRQVTLRLLRPALTWRTRLGYLLDWLLLLAIAYILASGLIISKVLLPYLFDPRGAFFYVNTHRSVSFIALALVGVHIGLHGEWLLGLLRLRQPGRALGILSHIAALLALAWGVYCLNAVRYFAVLGTLFTGENVRQFARPRPPDPLPVAAVYLGAMAVFAILTHYAARRR